MEHTPTPTLHWHTPEELLLQVSQVLRIRGNGGHQRLEAVQGTKDGMSRDMYRGRRMVCHVT